MMDPEPGRCRRTDGKKWRCRRNVITGYKYCELHVHRGRQGSRKLVEASEKIPQSGTTITPNFKKKTKPLRAKIATAVDTKFSTSIPVTASTYAPSTGTAKSTSTSSFRCNSRTNDIAASNCGSYVGLTTARGKQANIKIEITSATATTMDPIGATCANPNFDNKCEITSHTYNVNSKDNKKIAHGSSRGYTGKHLLFGFSPTSVLQDGKVLAQNIMENDLCRCKRTDGKKWQCGYDAVPDQKYCERHMYRGAKKSHVVPEPVTIAAAAPPLAIPKYVDECTNLNTDLSISIAGGPQQAADDENSYVSICSSSDATTISDNNVSDDQSLDLSP